MLTDSNTTGQTCPSNILWKKGICMVAEMSPESLTPPKHAEHTIQIMRVLTSSMRRC